MLNPAKNRVDYGGQLKPPAGYRFEVAVATTYSLDLNALLAVPVALCFGDTLEGDLQGEKIALLEALEQMRSRVKVFFQQGNIHVPAEFNRLFALLESFLAPVVPKADGANDAFTSFHPKLWLLRYGAEDDPHDKHYRLIVLSRNLTFDRSWDIAASIDGTPVDSAQARNAPLADFLASLLPHAGDFTPLHELISEVPQVRWTAPAGFKDLRWLPGGGAHIAERELRFGAPLALDKGLEALAVVSPFLDPRDARALSALAGRCDGTRELYSRAATLDALGASVLADWTCYSLNEALVSGEDMLEQSEPRQQDLHAKLFIARRGDQASWHLGSANATSAALGDLDMQVPRNTEFMMRMAGAAVAVGPDAMRTMWVGEHAKGIFQPHVFGEHVVDPAEAHAVAQRRLLHSLAAADWIQQANRGGADGYDVTLKVSSEIVIPSGFEVRIGLMAAPGRTQPFASETRWPGVRLTHLSAFVPLSVVGPEETETTLVVKSTLSIEGNPSRSAAVISELIDTPDKFLNYVRLLLHKSPPKEHWLGADTAAQRGLIDLFGFDASEGLFEQFMIATARYPDQLTRVRDLVDRLQRMDTPIPEPFLTLWQSFSQFAPVRK